MFPVPILPLWTQLPLRKVEIQPTKGFSTPTYYITHETAALRYLFGHVTGNWRADCLC